MDKENYLKVAGEPYCVCYEVNDESIFDEVRYYNFSLDNTQVSQINSVHDILGKGLVGYWKFNGDLKDYSGFKNDMFYNTLIASMAFVPDGRLFHTEKNSENIRIMANDTVSDLPFASIPDIHVNWEQGLLGLAIDSKFRENITFTNNPFNYTHFEEQFVNNPRDKIIIDYGIKFPKDYVEVYSKKNELHVDKRIEDVHVATYELNYGKGKVIVLGLSGGTLVQNQAGILVDNQKFKRFFDNVILTKSLCPKFQSCNLENVN